MNVFYREDGRLRSGWRFLISVIVVFLANASASVVANVTSSRRASEAIYRITLMLFLLLGFSVLLRTLDRVEEHPLAAMGLPARGWLGDSIHGFVVGLAMVSIAALEIAIFLRLSLRLDLDRYTLAMLVVELLVLPAAAMAEELVFRGYPFQRLVEGLGPLGAIAVLSALFGVLHFGNPNASIFSVFNTIAIGVVLALAYLRTRALWLPWGLHVGWNVTLGVFFGLPVSGLAEFASVVKGNAVGPRWLTGGAYGIEGGMLGTISVLLGFWYVSRFVPQIPERYAGATHQSAITSIQPQ